MPSQWPGREPFPAAAQGSRAREGRRGRGGQAICASCGWPEPGVRKWGCKPAGPLHPQPHGGAGLVFPWKVPGPARSMGHHPLTIF